MLKKRIQMFGAGLLVMAGLVFGSMEALTPVAEASQQPAYTCCYVHNDCPSGFTCADKSSDVSCPVSVPAYSKYCKPVKSSFHAIEGDQ